MFYTVYKITNRVNNKVYIGKHRTKDPNDKYMGSGKLIYSAIKKYGKDNFTKEVLFVYDNEQEMNNKEKELVNENFVKSKQSYNIALGGKGGFSPLHDNSAYGRLGAKSLHEKSKTDPELKESLRAASVKGGKAVKVKMDNDPEFAEKRMLMLREASKKGGQSFKRRLETDPEFAQEISETRRKARKKTII